MPATYVYCVVASPRAPRIGRAPSGLPDTGPLRFLEVAKGLFAVVADAPPSRYNAETINRKLSDLNWVSRAAVRHESVVEHFIDAKAVLPMKLFTIFDNDDRALDHMRSQRLRLASMARRVAGHHEWGVRVLLDRAKALEMSRARSDGRPAPRAATGADYLTRKKAVRDASAELATRARATVADVYDRLSKRARLSRRRTAAELPAAGGSLLLDAAFLVSRKKTASFRALAAERARALAPSGYAVTLTGPWPPYTFVHD